MKAKAAFYFFICVDNFYPWKDIVRKKVSKLRSFAELRAFYGSFYSVHGAFEIWNFSRITGEWQCGRWRCSTCPNRQVDDYTYWAGKGNKLIQDGGQMKKGKDIYHQCPRPIPIICHLPDPPCFSLVNTYKFCSPLSLEHALLALFKDFFHCTVEHVEVNGDHCMCYEQVFDWLTLQSMNP